MTDIPDTVTLSAAQEWAQSELKEAETTFRLRLKTLEALQRFPGAFEALIRFAEECRPVEDGEYTSWEYALDMCGPLQNSDGILSFEIPYSCYAWDAEAKAWREKEEWDPNKGWSAIP